MEQNKTGKYLKYAIGEIVLVMVGILLALQVNNWNIHRVENIQKKQYLIKLIENLQVDKKNLSTELEYANKLIREQDTLIGMILNAEKTTKKSFRKKVNHARRVPRFVVMSSTYQNLNNTGKLNLLENDNLINELFLYYNEVDWYIKGSEGAAFNLSRNSISPYLQKIDYFISSYNLRDKERELLTKSNFWETSENSIIDYVQDPELSNLMTSKRTSLKALSRDYNNLLKRNEGLMSIINNIISLD